MEMIDLFEFQDESFDNGSPGLFRGTKMRHLNVYSNIMHHSEQ